MYFALWEGILVERLLQVSDLTSYAKHVWHMMAFWSGQFNLKQFYQLKYSLTDFMNSKQWDNPANYNRSITQNKKNVIVLLWSKDSFYLVGYRGADKSLARRGRKQARKHVRGARDFNNIEKRAVIKFVFMQGKASKKIHAILTETLACFLPGRAKDLPAPLYYSVDVIDRSISSPFFLNFICICHHTFGVKCPSILPTLIQSR